MTYRSLLISSKLKNNWWRISSKSSNTKKYNKSINSLSSTKNSNKTKKISKTSSIKDKIISSIYKKHSKPKRIKLSISKDRYNLLKNHSEYYPLKNSLINLVTDKYPGKSSHNLNRYLNCRVEHKNRGSNCLR